MTEHVLDRPVWNSLTTKHMAFATGSDHARRYLPKVSPLAAMRDDSDESRAALGELVAATGEVIVAQVPDFTLPPSVQPTWDLIYDQMLYEGGPAKSASDNRVEALGAMDAADMLDLARLTEPGPFEIRTPELGQFWGFKYNGKLAAMAGERMRTRGFAEISAICTHPDHRGKGLARTLIAKVTRTILGRGETPFLHVNGTNSVAVSLYRSMGFRKRTGLRVVAMRPTHRPD